jgi:hypothetical protein
MAVVYGTERQPIGKIRPTKSGAVAASIGYKRLGLFVNENMAVTAIMDIADRPIEVEGYLEWVEALLMDEGGLE